MDALCRELEQRSHEATGKVRTLYVGGGTPTILTIDQIGQIVDAVRSNYDIAELEEATIEANPEDLTREYLQGLRGLGFFNRISIGVQSLRDEDLRLLNRRHSAKQAIDAVEASYDAGYTNISVDLIYGIPGLTEDAWRANLEHVGMLPVSHFSAYALTVEEGTILSRQIETGRVPAMDEDTMLRHYEILTEWAASKGLEHYEVSNFCRSGFRSKHNSRYWDRTPYVGVGASAHSFDGLHRRWNVSDVAQYVERMNKGDVYYDGETLSAADACNEYVMTALRTSDGIEKAKASSLDADKMQGFVEAGWVEETDTHWRPTKQGLLHADGMAAELFV